MIILILILTLFNIVMTLKNLKLTEYIKSREDVISGKVRYIMLMKENNCNHKCKNDGACRC